MEQSGDSYEVSTALKSIDLNSTKENALISTEENALISTEEKTGCFLCQIPDPIKKCSKSHSRCKGRLFCDKNCELSLHSAEKAAKKKVCNEFLQNFPAFSKCSLLKIHSL